MAKKAILYTGAGDDGLTTIYGQTERIPKYAPRPEACGQLDEAQAALGVLRAFSQAALTREILLEAERDLYWMMGELAVTDKIAVLTRQIGPEDITRLEQAVDHIGELSGGFSGFILPGDSPAGALAHLARTVVRRAERSVARLYHEHEIQNRSILVYLNRLSTLLYALAIYEDKQAGVSQPTFSRNT
jgi:cob(I)alamin adenosyltransferase